MGAFTGAMAPTSYILYGDFNPDLFIPELQRRVFHPIPKDSDRIVSYGWVQATEHDNTDLKPTTVYFGEHLLSFALREDKINVPSAQVKFRLNERVRSRLLEDGRDKMPRKEQEELKEDIVAEMRLKVFPTIKLYEVTVDLKNKRVWFFGKSTAVVQVFEDLFNETFSSILVPDSPFTVARLFMNPTDAENLTDLSTEPLMAE